MKVRKRSSIEVLRESIDGLTAEVEKLRHREKELYAALCHEVARTHDRGEACALCRLILKNIPMT
jgi:hypothetical protein